MLSSVAQDVNVIADGKNTTLTTKLLSARGPVKLDPRSAFCLHADVPATVCRQFSGLPLDSFLSMDGFIVGLGLLACCRPDLYDVSCEVVLSECHH